MTIRKQIAAWPEMPERYRDDSVQAMLDDMAELRATKARLATATEALGELADRFQSVCESECPVCPESCADWAIANARVVLDALK